MEGVLPRHGRGRHGAWHISLSKPSEKEQHLLMALVGEQGEWGSTLEAGQGLGSLAQHRAASRPGLCAIAPGRRAGAPPVWKLTRSFPVQACKQENHKVGKTRDLFKKTRENFMQKWAQ